MPEVKEFMFFHSAFLRYKVTVVAKEYASPVASGKRITSEIAGALWEWPPAVCGRHTDEKSLERSKVWCMDSYGKFMELAMNPKETGAYLRQSVFYFKEKVKEARPCIKIESACNVLSWILNRYLEEILSCSVKKLNGKIYNITVSLSGPRSSHAIGKDGRTMSLARIPP